MKKLLLLVVMCFVGMMVPQVVLADTYTATGVTITVTGKTVTIEANSAGALSTYLNSSDASAAIAAIQAATGDGSSIVFDGKFNESDLSTLSSKSCCVQETVNMSEAKFIKATASSSNYTLYHNSTPSNGSEGNRCIVGATKYESTSTGSFSLTAINESDNTSGNWTTKNILPSERNTITLYNADNYYKLPTTLNYYKLVVQKDEYNNETSRSWEQITEPTEEQISSAIAAEDSNTTSNLEDLRNNYQENQIIKIRTADCSSFEYFKSEQSFTWSNTHDNFQDYSDGSTISSEYWFSDLTSAGTPSGYGQAIYVGGTEYVYTNGQWDTPSSSSGTEEYDYTQMKFDYWGANVEEIITSQYATGNMATQLCNDCSNLQTLILKAGDFAANNSVLGNNINSLTTVNIQNGVTSLSDGMFNGKSSITTVTFEDGEQDLTVGEGCFNNCTGITSLALPARLSSMGKQAFANTTGVESLSIPENSRLTIIPEQAFMSCGNNTQAEFDITIPRSVTEIQKQAFGDMARLKIVRFTGQNGDPALIIRDEAFAGGEGSENNSTLSDVYVNINPNDRKLICEYHAFGYVPMEGQTSVENLSQLATLHFSEEYWDYYAGDWKKGITFDQNALNSFKDGCNTSSGTPVGDQSMFGTNEAIVSNNGHIEGKSPANGWQQFAKTDTGIDIIVPVGKFYRTYSTPIVLVKPDWMKIYRVKSFSDGYTEGADIYSANAADAATKAAYTEELDFSVTDNGKTYKCIPSGTGVIRVDTREVEAIYYFLEWSDLSTAYQTGYNNNASSWEYPYNETTDNKNNRTNYLVPTNGSDAQLAPVIKDGNTITHRIFGLLKQTETGLVPQFSRAKVCTLGDHRAYLKLPAEVFHWKNEKSGSSQDATGNDVVVDTRAAAYSKISLFFDEDFEEVNGGIATEIINSIEEDMYKNDSFYTLQGIKVAKPTTKGVYIHNGKKIFIK